MAQLAEHAENKHRSNWMSTFLVGARTSAAGYPNTVAGVNDATRDLFVLLPNNERHGRINPFITFDSANKWLKISESGRSTVWNTATRRGTQRVLFVDDHFQYGLRDDAIDTLLTELGDSALPARDALSILLTRELGWSSEPSREELHTAARDQVGLTAEDFARITAEVTLPCQVLGEPEWSPSLLEASRFGPPSDLLPDQPVDTVTGAGGDDTGETSHAWTENVCRHPLRDADVAVLTARVLADVQANDLVFPDPERLVRRCVTALLVGNLVLQGPPGTGKTTLARILAEAFNVRLLATTATSEWSPYHVVGGYRPHSDNSLKATYGEVTTAVRRCADIVRRDVCLPDPADADADADGDGDAGLQGAWLLIDEFNRADIDKAIGSLFTVLSRSDPEHLVQTPIDLWFENAPGAQTLWVPARFRIIAAMNDLDTSFVNPISQGLIRRFQFVTVGTPSERGTEDTPVTPELENAIASAYRWLDRTYGPQLGPGSLTDARAASQQCLERLQRVIDGLRHNAGRSGVDSSSLLAAGVVVPHEGPSPACVGSCPGEGLLFPGGQAGGVGGERGPGSGRGG